jgi:hypothetical protein
MFLGCTGQQIPPVVCSLHVHLSLITPFQGAGGRFWALLGYFFLFLLCFIMASATPAFKHGHGLRVAQLFLNMGFYMPIKICPCPRKIISSTISPIANSTITLAVIIIERGELFFTNPTLEFSGKSKYLA